MGQHSFVISCCKSITLSTVSTAAGGRNMYCFIIGCFCCCCWNKFAKLLLPSSSPLLQFIMVLLLVVVEPADHQQLGGGGTPVIGGVCKLDTPDVHIGGKQTQFFLRCEPTNAVDAAPGEGVWVVKSRRAGGSSTAEKISAAVIVSQQENGQGGQQHTKKMTNTKSVSSSSSSYVCDLVADAVEHGYCTSSENCLQPVYTDRTAFLQCDPTTRRWAKKHCQSGFNFDFERQACIAHTAKMAHHFRQFPKRTAEAPAAAEVPTKRSQRRAIVCTFAQCSVREPCNAGSCNDGYCCNAAVGSLPRVSVLPMPSPSSHTKWSAESNSRASISSSTSSSTTNRPPAAVPPPIPSILVIELNNNNNNNNNDDDGAVGGTSLLMDDFVDDEHQQRRNHLHHQRRLNALSPSSSSGGTLLRPPAAGSAIAHYSQQQQQHPLSSSATQIDHCSTGFMSPIRCGGTNADECPVGLMCELGTARRLCCPFPPKQKRNSAIVPGGHQLPPPQTLAVANGGAKSVRRRMAMRRHDRFGRTQLPIDANDNAFTPDQQLNMFICPTGAPALGPCAPGFCVAPMQCAGALCCAPPAAALMPPPPPPVAYACPGGMPALGPCMGGRCASPGTICASPANVCCAQSVPTAIPATVCPDGTQAAGACVNGQCGAGFTCNQGLCCTNSSQTPRCLDGSQSIGACIQGKCGTGYSCTTGNICCPSQLNLCPPGQTSVGQAVNGRCPAGYTNFNGQCCGPQSAQSQVSCSVEDSFGRCDNNQQCTEPGFACDVANNWCCPQVIGDAIGPCIQGEGGNRLCPEGYACVGDGEGQCFRLDTGTCPPEEQSGPCAPDGSCPAGYECIEGFCCQTDVGGTANPVTLLFRQRLRQRRRRRAAAPAAASAFLQMVNYDKATRQ